MGNDADCRRLLFADNDDDMREMVAHLFKARGVAVLGVSGCESGLRALKRGGICLVLLDLGMSPIDGLTCGQTIKVLYPNLPVYAYTAYQKAVYPPKRLLEHGFDGIYQKGMEDLKMIDEISELMLCGNIGGGIGLTTSASSPLS